MYEHTQSYTCMFHNVHSTCIFVVFCTCVVFTHTYMSTVCWGSSIRSSNCPSAPAKGDTGLADCAGSVIIRGNPHRKAEMAISMGINKTNSFFWRSSQMKMLQKNKFKKLEHLGFPMITPKCLSTVPPIDAWLVASPCQKTSNP